MTDISRRGFLGGAAACAAAAAMPLPALPMQMPRIFEGAMGIYNGILVREVWSIDLQEAALFGLQAWTCQDDGEIRVFPLREVLADGR